MNNLDSVRELLPNYKTDNFLIYWLKLTKKALNQTNIICNDKDNSPMTKTDMIELLGITERTFRDFYKESIAKGIMVENTMTDGLGTRVQYVLNPIYTIQETPLNIFTMEMFKNDSILQDYLKA